MNYKFIFFCFFSIFLLVFTYMVYIGSQAFGTYRISSDDVLTSALDESLQVRNVIGLESGVALEILDMQQNILLRVLGTEITENVPSVSPHELLEAVRKYRIRKVEDSSVSPLVLRYLSAHFDSRRARMREDSHVSASTEKIPTVKFYTIKGHHYELGSVAYGMKQIAFLAHTKDRAVPSVRLSEIIGELRVKSKLFQDSAKETEGPHQADLQ